MANKLYLFRYPNVKLDLSQSSVYWPLSKLGQKQAHKIAEFDFWVEVSKIYTSTELKAVQTLEVITARHRHIKHHTLPGMNESERPTHSLPDEEYLQHAQAFFAHPEKPATFGWASSGAVRHLVISTFRDIIASLQQSQESVALITHGLALTLLHAYLVGQSATYEDWQKILPSAWAIVDVATAQLEQDFQTVDITE